MSRSHIDWDDCPPELQDLLDEKCAARVALAGLNWAELRPSAQHRIQQQCMAAIESAANDADGEFRVDQYEASL